MPVTVFLGSNRHCIEINKIKILSNPLMSQRHDNIILTGCNLDLIETREVTIMRPVLNLNRKRHDHSIVKASPWQCSKRIAAVEPMNGSL